MKRYNLEKCLENEIKELAESYGRDVEELKKNEHLKMHIEENLKTEKAIEYIVDNAKIK